MTKPAPTQNFNELLGLDEAEFNPPTVVDEPPPEEVEGADTAGPIEVVIEQHVERQNRGRRGRPKGSIAVRKQATKNSIMQQRIALEAGLRDYMEHPNRRILLRDAMDRILRVAAYGLEDKDSVSAMRVLLEKLMSTVKQEEEATGHAPPVIQIEITNATARVAPPAIEAQFTEVKRE